MDLLNRLDNLEIDNVQRISLNDKNYCEKLNEKYHAALLKYQNMKNHLQKMSVDFEDPYQIVENNYHDNIQLKNEDADCWTLRKEGFPSFFIVKIDNAIKNIHQRFIVLLVDYFSSTYGINLNRNSFCEKFQTNLNINWTNILDAIFEYIGNEELESKGIQEFKEAFKKSIYCINKVQIKKSKIILPPNQVAYCEYSSYLKFDYSNDIFYIIKALSFFEFDIMECVSIFYHELPSSNTELDLDIYETPKSKKFKGLKLFKNGRIDLIFRSEAYALEFAKLFDLPL